MFLIDGFLGFNSTHVLSFNSFPDVIQLKFKHVSLSLSKEDASIKNLSHSETRNIVNIIYMDPKSQLKLFNPYPVFG